VPLKLPFVFSVNPGGKALALVPNEYGAVPPVAENVWL
jgi:hypothetical protein